MKSDSVPRILVIGCGAVVEELHGAALRKIERQGLGKIVALADPSEKQLTRFKKSFPKAQGYADAKLAYAAQTIDITLIASPPGLHRAHCELAIQSGSHVLCEKPMTTNAADATYLANLSAQSKKILAVGLTRRFIPSLATAAKFVAEGKLGDNLKFTYREGDAWGWPLASDAPFRRKISGGGVLADKGVHVLDSLLWVFGQMNVESALDDAQSDGVEANIIVNLASPKVKGTLHLSYDQALNNGFWIYGSTAELWVQPGQFRFVCLRSPKGAWERVPCAAVWANDMAEKPALVAPANYDACIWLQWIAMLRALKYGESVPVDAAKGQFVIAQIEEAYRVVSALPQPWLGEKESATAAALHWKTA